MKTGFIISLLIISLFISSCASEVRVSTPTAQPTPTPQVVELEWDIFPLVKGAYWVYEGPVLWQEGTEVREKHFTWKMEVIDTVPDHQILEFVPGIGITHYVYGHHGTVSNVDVRLVEYHPGQ